MTTIRRNFVRRILLSLLLTAILVTAGGYAATVSACADGQSIRFLPHTLDTGKFETSVYRTTVPISPDMDGISYQWSGTHLEFVLRDGINAKALNTANLALDFWLFSTKPQSEFTGDNQIEISSNVSQHDANEYNWTASDIFWNTEYKTDTWLHCRLKFTGHKVGQVDLADLKYMRMYYLFGENSKPIYVSDVKIVETTPDAPFGIIEKKELPTLTLVQAQLPQNAKEGDTVTYAMPEIRDLNGERIDDSKISITTVGAYGYRMPGKTVLLEDGGGTYTVEYEVTDLLGRKTVLTRTFSVTEAGEDVTAPRVRLAANMPADFMTGRQAMLSDYVLVTDNRGQETLQLRAIVQSSDGTTAASYEGTAENWSLAFTPQKGLDYTLQLTATDAAGNTTDFRLQIATYNDADAQKEVKLFDTENGDLEFMTGTVYNGRMIGAKPQNGYGKSIHYKYAGGATDLNDNATFRHEMILINNNPADLSGIDMRWACLKLWIFIDRVYSSDATWMPSDGSGYGNMGIGISSAVGIYGLPRMDYPLNEMRLKAGWNEVTIKLGRMFDGQVDLSAISEIYLYANFGSARQMLLNDIRLVESNEFPEGLMGIDKAPNASAFYKVKHSNEQIGASAGDVNYDVDIPFRDTYYRGSPMVMPGLVITDFQGNKDYVDEPEVVVTNPVGGITESIYFTPEVEGEHTVVLTGQNYYGHTVRVEKTFTVLPPNDLPIIDLGNLDESTLRYRLGSAFGLPKIVGKDPAGEAVTLDITVYSPKGEKLTPDAKGKYSATMTGRHLVKVIATDAAGQKVKTEFHITVFTETKSTYNPMHEPAVLGGIIGGTIGGAILLAAAVVLILAAVKGWWFFKKKDKKPSQDSLKSEAESRQEA